MFSFKLKIIPNDRSRYVSSRFLERNDSYPIRLVSLFESECSNPSPLRKSCRKNLFQWKQKAYPVRKLEQRDSDPLWWKHSTKVTRAVPFHKLIILHDFEDNLIFFILCFHYIGSLFGPFRNNPSHFAVQWKRKCCWIDSARFLFPFGAIR